MKRLVQWGAFAAIVWMVWSHYAPIKHAPGILAPMEPEQMEFRTPQKTIMKKGFTLKPLARYSIEARVLSMKHYSGTEPDKLAPYDAAVGWGRMSDTAVLEKLDITQGNRFFHWRYWGQNPPIPVDEIICHAANMHLIPDDERILGQLAALKTGMVVKLQGYLVEATHPMSATPWRSSLTRTDDGDGACEVMLVEIVKVIPR
jgi:hypothetical protein